VSIIQTFTDPGVLSLYTTAVLAAVPVVMFCGLLSTLVVVKRLGFVGQGVSHSAFGGVGLVAVLLPLEILPAEGPWAAPAQFGVIATFCTAAAWAMGLLGNKRSLPVDTAIGVLLVGSMGLGAILTKVGSDLARAREVPGLVQSWESILFGSIFGAGPADAWLAWVVCLLMLGVLWWVRRPLMFWAIDEESAVAFGVPVLRIKLIVMTSLALTIVIAMKLTGVILATALLALPGAIALRLCSRMWTSATVAVASALVALLGGLVLSIQTDWPAGPSVVAVLVLLFVAASLGGMLPRRSYDGV
jgi:zinc transport system permease protein